MRIQKNKRFNFQLFSHPDYGVNNDSTYFDHRTFITRHGIYKSALEFQKIRKVRKI